MVLRKVLHELLSLASPKCLGNVNLDTAAVHGAGLVLRVLMGDPPPWHWVEGQISGLSLGWQTEFSKSLFHGRDGSL